ncbi:MULTISPECIES: TetR/AcrR family transcriptional regulator [Rhodococcus]|uniref:WHG domain-containing protein n=1 Tax=Rhodococcus oxybenzonivorans TaxID=1990687 RepID=A0AAE5A730_9NOCA|nr:MULTISPECIES: WHG domain-containing protein [Rhodococcus]MDV7241070.1 WHG domain-containing protein [Rhodococcus oxybenzonivorans]MDV7266257.1 WHG domain-containing protein [Rhodococcus oxybenzonivorans]MDV7273343.1 WHG domain-containing protein [Rhodococcus oxybenzonivorans]MDV7332919.1 WHG domain-containing protein [Rhodococcus oxybenzonivorans]MDV7342085.1 WHG domain-containing protein [Rhodococcus oxybenzonivorans]
MARGQKEPIRRRTLTREKVVDAAIDIIDELGWDPLSMTSLSARLEVVTASLYNHVRNLDDVRGAVQVRTMAELGAHLRETAMGRTGVDGLRALVDAHRAWATEHPHRYRTLTTSPVDRDAFISAALDANMALRTMLKSCGVPPEDTLDAAVSIFAAMHGFVMLVNTDFLGDELDLDSIYESVLRGALSSIEWPERTRTPS